MADFKGGRGKRVTYQTEMYRIPSPIRPVVEKLGMQFRTLWDGPTDPKGEKLISRIEAAISTDGSNQISGKGEVTKPDSKYEELNELRSQLKNCQRVTEEQKLEIDKLRKLEKNGADILKQALDLKANAGGKIKDQIREALKLIDDI